MPRKAKIDDDILARMLREGKSTNECAEFFGVKAPAISRKKKMLGIKGTRKLASSKQIDRAVSQSLDAVDQMQKINRRVNEILDLAMAVVNGDKDATEKLSDKVYEKDGENVGIVFKLKDPRQLVLKASAEIRKQLRLHLDIYEMLHNQQASKEFQDTVLEVLGNADPELRTKVLDRLQEKRAIRSAIGFGR